MRCVPLELAAEKVCDESSKPPLIFTLPPAEGRLVLEKAQDTPVYKCPAKTTKIRMNLGRLGTINVFCIQPTNIVGIPNIIFYIHGAGWVFGSLHTHEKLVLELASRTNSVLIFPEYSRSPEAKYPIAIEQCYQVLCHLPQIFQRLRLQVNYSTLTVAGDSVGGNMATVMTILAKYHNGPKIHKQLMYYPVTNACFDTESYCMFAEDYYLYRDGMIWFWDQYTTLEEDRNQITASPLRATKEQLYGLPDAMILNGEADVLRSEGEAYARELRAAGVEVTAVRFQAIIHDFVMLNSLDQTNACRAAMDSSTSWINRKNECS
ncbi:alpha/beta hydrolase [Anaerosporobacter sp.]|uniref:alpha/beta hydrolase n=1 Tax=Anaerosporobacter sp. TaxID=1872529 RepID=UPI00286F584B|nr:alpha/beta hydrolase [Anaerosporobacter sp.]